MNYTLNEMIIELIKSKLYWVIRNVGTHVFYTTSVSGYDICIIKCNYSDGYTVKIEVSYKNSERDIVELVDFEVVVKCEGDIKFEKLSAWQEVKTSPEYYTLLELLKKLESDFNESKSAINLITEHLRSINNNA